MFRVAKNVVLFLQMTDRTMPVDLKCILSESEELDCIGSLQIFGGQRASYGLPDDFLGRCSEGRFHGGHRVCQITALLGP